MSAKAPIKDEPEHLAKAPVRKSRTRIRLENLAWQIVIGVAFLGLWEYASERWISALLVSKPSRIATRFHSSSVPAGLSAPARPARTSPTCGSSSLGRDGVPLLRSAVARAIRRRRG